MKSKTKKTFLMAFVAVALPISLMASTLLTSNKLNPFNFVKGVANVESGNHYARIDATEARSGVREYYVSCDDHQHYVLENGKMYFRGVHYSDKNNIQIIIANYTSTFNNGSNFLATDSGFNINQTDSTVAQAGWFSQAFVDGKYRLLTACFPNDAVDGQFYFLIDKPPERK